MRKPAFCICKNKGANQLRSDHAADQRLCFRYVDSTIPLLSESKILCPYSGYKSLTCRKLVDAIFCGRTARFGSDMVVNPEDRFSHDAAHIIYRYTLIET